MRAGAEGLAAGRGAFTIERGHPTLPLHRPCGRSPSPWQGRFCPGPSVPLPLAGEVLSRAIIPACTAPAQMHPRRGGHWPSAVKTKKTTRRCKFANPTGYEFASARSIFGGSFRGRAMLAPTCAYRRGCVVTARDAHTPLVAKGLVCCVRDPYRPTCVAYATQGTVLCVGAESRILGRILRHREPSPVLRT